MKRSLSRRRFLKRINQMAAGAGVIGATSLGRQSLGADKDEKGFKISLAEWSLHRALHNGDMDNLDFARVAREDFGISAIEYVNQFFMDEAKDREYLKKMKKRAKDHGVRSLLIMCDREGPLASPDKKERLQAVDNHKKWVEAAKFLGCHSIRVNARGKGTYDEQKKQMADGLRRLCEYAEPFGINVLVENHGGLSSNGKWLSEVMKLVDHKLVGTLPDFGNFGDYDRYKGVKELMPWAEGVSAKSVAFDESGNEANMDYTRLLKIVLDAGYHGYVGVEYGGRKHSEAEGIRLTKRLLERVREKLAG